MVARTVRFLVVFLATLGTLYTLRAQIPGEDWTRIAVLGINTQSVALSPNYTSDGTVFAGTQGMGVWVSRDWGGNWGQSGDATLKLLTIKALAVSPSFSADLTVFALSSDGKIYKSMDGGKTFGLKYSVPSGSGTSLAISPVYSLDQRIFAGFAGQGFWYSTDGGATWIQDTASMTRMPIIFALAISPRFSSDGLVFLGGHGQDFPPVQSWVAGFWSSKGQGLGAGASEYVTALAIKSANELWAGTLLHGMWYTTNGGTGWTAACDGTTIVTVPAILSLAVPRAATTLLEGRNDRLFTSVSAPLGISCAAAYPMGLIQGLAFEPQWDGTNFCEIYIATPMGLFRKGCAVPPASRGPRVVDGKAVALANQGKGAFMGSGGGGLFKAAGRNLLDNLDWGMVQYNNFPNKQTPDVVSICLDPLYDETSNACGVDASILFVAVNFPNNASANGVYKSTNFGNSWTKLIGGVWPTTYTITVNDLAISPQYREGTSDTTLFAATSDGVLRWDGVDGWSAASRGSKIPAFRVAVAPTFSRLGNGTYDHFVFESEAVGLFYSSTLGNATSWLKISSYAELGCANSSTITGFAFPYNFGLSGGTTRMFVSNSATTCHSIDTSPGYPWSSWAPLNDGLKIANEGAFDIAAEPDFDENTTQKRLICATAAGTYYGTFSASPTAKWVQNFDAPALSVTFDQGGVGSLSYAMAGFNTLGARFSGNGGASFTRPLTGYSSLPDDVFQTIAHTRNSDILFSSSPSMGVFVSENKGLSYRPWNVGAGGTSGPCAIRDAYGLAMMTDRAGSGWPGWDVVWAGTKTQGIKYRWTVFSSPSAFNLDGWSWYDTTLTTGRFERFTTLGTGQANRVYAASPAPGTGIFYTPDWSTWTTTSSPGLASPSVKFGYLPLVTVTPLTSGVATGVQSVTNTTWNYYSITVPSGMGSLQITMTPSAGDPDLYVRRGGIPDLNLWDYRPYYGGLAVETVTVNFPTPGIWYFGVHGYSTGTSTYNLVATVSASPLAPALERTANAPGSERMAPTPEPKPELNPFESAPGPKAPSGGTVWGTVLHAGVVGGTPSAGSVVWESRNGTGAGALTNLDAQTLVQLKDGTLVLGCLNDAFYSPQPDEGRTTWISSTANFAGACSYDFRDLYQVDLDPATASDMRADCLIAAYGTGVSTSGGVWLSGDKGHHWMKISSGFDTVTQKLNSIISDVSESASPTGTTSYYSSTNGTGVYTRTITLQPYPTVTTLSSSSGNVTGGGPITVTGTGFSNACPTGAPGDCPNASPVVLFGTTEAATTWTDATHLSATVPAHALGGVSVTVRNPDTRQAVSGPTYAYNACSSPSGAGAITATDLDPYLKSGVQVAWPANCTWNDGDPTGRLYRVLRGGVDISGAIAYGAPTTYTDLTGSVGVSYNYSVRYTSGCGGAYFVESTAVPQADQYLVPPEAASTPVAALQWTSGLKTQVTWGATTGATGYKLYKGTDTVIANLPAGAAACIAYQGAGIVVNTRLGTTTTLTNEPASGHFYWYLLAATNGAGDGPLAAGQVVTSTGACASP